MTCLQLWLSRLSDDDGTERESAALRDRRLATSQGGMWLWSESLVGMRIGHNVCSLGGDTWCQGLKLERKWELALDCGGGPPRKTDVEQSLCNVTLASKETEDEDIQHAKMRNTLPHQKKKKFTTWIWRSKRNVVGNWTVIEQLCSPKKNTKK